MSVQVTNPRRFISLTAFLIAVILLLAFFTFISGARINRDGEFTIESGTSSRQVWSELAAEGYTSHTLAWKYYSWRQEAAGKIQAGTYQLTTGEKVSSVVSRFVSGDAVLDELAIIYPEGFTLAQIAERTAAKGIGTKEEFMSAASDPLIYAESFPFLLDLASSRTLEGYLFPDTYRVFENDTPEDVIRRMLANFNEKISTAGIPEAAETSGRTLDEVVIMASIVEREVQTDVDMAKVAGILWKRFDEGIGLGADATVRYVIDKQTGPLTAADLGVDSPYNTRRYRGLTPGPISNPGLRALTAAANPEDSPYYYYLSAPSGETIFAETNDQHNVNKAEYLQ